MSAEVYIFLETDDIKQHHEQIELALRSIYFTYASRSATPDQCIAFARVVLLLMRKSPYDHHPQITT